MSQHLSQSMHSSGLGSPMSNVSNIVINNYSGGGTGQQLLSPVKADLFGDSKPPKWKPSTDNYPLMKPIKKTNRKETQKSASTQLIEKAELVVSANETIHLANGELEESRATSCRLYDAGMEAVVKSKKQSKQAAALKTTVDKLGKKIEALEKKLKAKTELVEKLRGEANTAKEKRRIAEDRFKSQKDIFADAHKAMKESNTLVANENKEKAATIKRLESELEKARRENEKLLKAEGADGGKRNDNSLENKMAFETHKRLMEAFVKSLKDASDAKKKTERFKTIVSGGGKLPGAFGGGISGSFADFLGGVMKNEEQTKEKKRGRSRSRSSRRRSHRSSSKEHDSSVSSASSNRKSKRRDCDRKSEKRRRHSRDHKSDKRRSRDRKSDKHRSRGRSRRPSPSADDSSYSSGSSTSYHHKRESDRKKSAKNRSRDKENKVVAVVPPPSNVPKMSTDAIGSNVHTTSRNLFNSFSTPATHKNDGTFVTQLTQTHPDPEENDNEPNIGMYLTPDSIKGMLGCGDNANIKAHTPTVQVLAIKEISNDSPTAVKRWKLVVSDGEFYMSGMLATQLNDMVASGEIKQNAIIKLKHFMLTTIPESGARIFVLLEAEHQQDMEKRLGDPVDIKKALKGNDA